MGRGSMIPVVSRALILGAAIGVSACSGVSLDAARQLSLGGRAVAGEAKQTAIASDEEFLRARDAEALFHGFAGSTDEAYKQVLQRLGAIHRELTSRGLVFDRLVQLYEAFGDLTAFDAATATEAALGDLGGAIEEYAKQIGKPPPVSTDVTAVISKVGGLVAGAIQKARIKEASILIRGQVEAFTRLLSDPLVQEQMVGFQKTLLTDRKTALILVWRAGVLDPKPLLDDLGSVGGLVGQKDAAQGIVENERLRNALAEVLDKRLALQQDAIESGYKGSVEALKRLVAEHQRLENGEAVDLARLRAIVAQLRAIVDLLGKARRGGQ